MLLHLSLQTLNRLDADSYMEHFYPNLLKYMEKQWNKSKIIILFIVLIHWETLLCLDTAHTKALTL